MTRDVRRNDDPLRAAGRSDRTELDVADDAVAARPQSVLIRRSSGGIRDHRCDGMLLLWPGRLRRGERILRCLGESAKLGVYRAGLTLGILFFVAAVGLLLWSANRFARRLKATKRCARRVMV